MNPEKKKARFNLVDALIILIILAVVGAAVYLIASGTGEGINKKSDTVVTFTVRISDVDEESLSLIRENDLVKNSTTGKSVGTIRAVRTEKAHHFGTTAIPDGKGGYTVATTEYSDKYDVYVTISANAKTDKNGICRVGDVRILVGSPLNFKVPSFAKVSYIVEFALIPVYTVAD